MQASLAAIAIVYCAQFGKPMAGDLPYSQAAKEIVEANPLGYKPLIEKAEDLKNVRDVNGKLQNCEALAKQLLTQEV